MAKSEAKKIALKVREELRDSGEIFTVEQFKSLVFERCQHLWLDAYEGMVEGVCDAVDRQATTTQPFSQLELFDLRGDYALGKGDRIARAHSRADQMKKALAIDDANLAAVAQANQAKHEEYKRLLPYWGPGVRKSEAVRAYHLANPIDNSKSP